MIKKTIFGLEIYLYDEAVKGVDFRQIEKFLSENFGSLKFHLVRLKSPIVATAGIIFDLIKTQKAFGQLEHAAAEGACHVILTNKIFATQDQHRQPHIRASIYSDPSVISLPGIVEGPAKPREYYLYKQRYSRLRVWELKEAQVKEKFKRHFIDYNDRRLTEVLKGYISQAIFFYLTGEPFCRSRGCRLFNSHWQADLIYSQIRSGKFCARHKRALAAAQQKGGNLGSALL